MEQRYTAQEVAEILRREGDSKITTRTVNYYAFEKNMFEVSGKGKGTFSAEDIEKIRAIRILQCCTNYTLAQIKEVIKTQRVGEILQTYATAAQLYAHSQQSPSQTQLTWNSSVGNVSTAGSTGCPYPPTSLDTLGVPVAAVRNFPQSAPTDYTNSSLRTIKINQDVTLTVSENITKAQLAKIIEFINKLRSGVHED